MQVHKLVLQRAGKKTPLNGCENRSANFSSLGTQLGYVTGPVYCKKQQNIHFLTYIFIVHSVLVLGVGNISSCWSPDPFP